MIIITYILSLLSILFNTEPMKLKADFLIINARIYTLSPNNTIVEAIAIDKGKIIFIGTTAQVKEQYSSINEIDLEGKSVFPGFIDAHCHFYGYGEQLKRVNLVGTESWDEVVTRVKKFAQTNKASWIQGRGWDQNDWALKEFPTNELLNQAFPDQPVFIKRIDGHAAVANNVALKIAGFSASTKISGGELKIKNGILTGVLVDNAMDSLEKSIPLLSKENIIEALMAAQEKCFAVGLTTVSDAGLDKEIVDIIDSLQQQGLLKMRVYAMLTDNEVNRNYYYKYGPYKTERLTVRAFKFYADGALGSRGALLKKPYNDDPKNIGLLLKPIDYFTRKFAECEAHGFQVCVHCIGDSANKLILDLYGKILKGKNMNRWRIEHAQIVSPTDMKLFESFSVIPSIQPCFTTSDMYWAETRIGKTRMVGAYSWNSLLEKTGIVACGSDFPIEDINPLYGFFAAITRMDQKLLPVGGFMPSENLTRDAALKGMTTWAAYTNFSDEETGSLTIGKYADLVVLENDIMTMPLEETFKAKVLMTFVNGELVYKK